MRFPLTAQLIEEARRFELRSACQDCFFWDARGGECWHGWPDEGQRRWPLALLATSQADAAEQCHEEPLVTEAAFCKEFELR
jgi:hypothetical protein